VSYVMTETTLDLTITISKLESDKLVLNKRIAELESAQTKWISVEDVLPSFGVDVLVYPIKMHLGDEPVYTGHRVKGDNFEYIWAGSIYTIINVTDWMPLPEPPKNKGGAE
jgi:hypothetical protein